jgi:outer membrane protein assembly factor BamB
MAAALGTMCPRTLGRWGRLALAGSAVVAVLLSLASGARAAAPAWTTYHHDSQRSGIDPDSAAALTPEPAWHTEPLDGSMYAEPLVYGSLVYAATKNDTVYALNAATGAIVWQSHVGTAVPTGTPGLELSAECNQVGSQVGIMSTPVIDPATNAIYAVTTTWSGTHESVSHELVALDLDTGAMLPGFPMAVDPPYPAGGSASEQLQRPALALDAGRIVIGYGSYGDCNTYWGWLVSAPESGAGPLQVFQVDQNHEEGSIWASGNAPLIEPDGDIYVATANGVSGSVFEYGDAVLRLDSNLDLLESWAPENWEELDMKDLDLGSSNPVPLPGTGLVFEGGKAGNLVLLHANALGAGPGPPVASLQVCTSVTETEIMGGGIYLPGPGPDEGAIYLTCVGEGIKKVEVSGLPSEPKLSVVAGFAGGEAAQIVGPPIFAGGLVWVSNWAGSPATPGTLFALTPSGEVDFKQELGANLHFATPSAGGGRLFVANGAVVNALTIATPPPPSHTSTAISPSANPASAGQPVSYTAAVSPAPDSGYVTFTEDGLPIPGCEALHVDAATGGAANCPTSYAQAGAETILASYSGDPYYTASSSAPLGELITLPPSSAPTPMPSPTGPVISDPGQSHRRWRAGRANAQFSRRHTREPVGTTFTFAVNEPARVHFAFERETFGHRVGARCLPTLRTHTRGAHHLERCTHLAESGALEFAGHAGLNHLSFAGRTSHRSKLAPGRYVLVITASNALGTSAPADLAFEVLKG